MNTRNYFVSININGVLHQSFWTDEKPLRLGLNLPWELKSEEGVLVLEHATGHRIKIKPSIIENSEEIRLPLSKEKSSPEILFTIAQIDSYQSAWDQVQTSESGVDGVLSVFTAQAGASVLHNYVRLGNGYTGHGPDGSLFRIKLEGGSYRISDRKKELEVLLDGQATEQQIFTAAETARLTLRKGDLEWRIGRVKMPQYADETAEEKDDESVWFGRLFKVANAAVVLLLLMTWTAGYLSKKEEEEKPQQFARVVIKKRLPKPRPREIPVAAKQAPEQKIKKVTEARPAKKAPKKVAVNPSPTAPAEPVKPKPNAALVKAQNLQNSLKNILGGKNSLLLSQTPQGDAQKAPGTQKVFNGRSNIPGAGKAGLEVGEQQNVAVAFTDLGNGKPGSGAGYTVGTEGGKYPGAGMGGGASFVDVGLADGDGAVVDNGLDPSEVAAVINRHMHEVRYCYQNALKRSPAAEGKILVNFVINAGGRVKTQAVKDSTLDDQLLGQCLLKRVASWQFPKPRGAVDVKVEYPFAFRRL